MSKRHSMEGAIGFMKMGTSIRAEGGQGIGTKKPPEGAKVIEEGKFWKLWEHEYEEGQPAFGISFNMEEGAPLVADKDFFRLNQLQYEVPKWQILSQLVHDNRTRLKFKDPVLDEMWDMLQDGVNRFRRLLNDSRGVKVQRNLEDAAVCFSKGVYEQEKKTVEEFRKAEVEFEMSIDEGMNEKTTVEFAEWALVFASTQALRWAMGLCVELKEPDEDAKRFLAMPGMQALIEKVIEPYRGRFAKQLRQEIRAVS